MQAALVGLQHPHAMSHLATLQQLPEVESIAVCGESREDLERVEAGQGAKVTAWHTDPSAMLKGASPLLCHRLRSQRPRTRSFHPGPGSRRPPDGGEAHWPQCRGNATGSGYGRPRRSPAVCLLPDQELPGLPPDAVHPPGGPAWGIAVGGGPGPLYPGQGPQPAPLAVSTRSMPEAA